MRVLVTGGLGYLGRAVAAELAHAGHSVDVLTRDASGATPPDQVRVVEADIRDRQRIAQVLSEGGYDGVCHLAALTRARDSINDPVSYYDVNVGGTVNLLAALPGGTRFVLASTSLVYGSQRTGVLGEDLPTRPENPYGGSKVAAEQLVIACTASGAVSGTILRCFNVAGAVDGYPDADRTRLIPNVLRAARGDTPHVSVNGDGSAVREYTHVRDAGSAFRLALETTAPGVYNVGTGRGVAVRDVIAIAEQITGRLVPVAHQPPRPEPHTLISDPAWITAQLGWRPVHSDLPEIIHSAWLALLA
jgi:UDP-glucose 4-epimerase